MPDATLVGERMRPGAVVVAWHDSAEAAFARMRAAGLEAVPVVNGPRVIGMIERGAARACQSGGNWLDAVPVASLMRRGAFWCRASDSLERALATMERLDVDLLAVLDEDDRIVGLIDRERAAPFVTGSAPYLAAGASPVC